MDLQKVSYIPGNELPIKSYLYPQILKNVPKSFRK
jgi:hypothetical protein